LVLSAELLQVDGTPNSAKPEALPAEVDTLKELQRQTSQEFDALLPAILDQAFRGEL
jgi:hypothetical protein